MRFCPFCAQENPDDSRECVHCGKRLPALRAVKPVAPPPKPAAPSRPVAPRPAPRAPSAVVQDPTLKRFNPNVGDVPVEGVHWKKGPLFGLPTTDEVWVRIVGMSVNTVKSHLHRALQSLRRKPECARCAGRARAHQFDQADLDHWNCDRAVNAGRTRRHYVRDGGNGQEWSGWRVAGHSDLWPAHTAYD